MNDLKTSLSYALLSTLCGLFSLLPLSILHAFGRLTAWLAWLKNGRTRRYTEQNLALCFPDQSDQQREQLAREHLRQLGMCFFEMPAVWFRPRAKVNTWVKNVVGEEHLQAGDKGVLLLAPHIGNWELLGAWLGIHHNATSMFQPPDNAAANQLLMTSRSKSGQAMVPTNVSGVKALLRCLKQGGLVGVLPDQVPPEESGEMAPFFGIPALTATMSFNLLNRTGAAVVFAYARRLPNSRGFEIVISKAPEAIYTEQSAESLRALNGGVEDCIADVPAQYQWEYKRFKGQPDGRNYYQRK